MTLLVKMTVLQIVLQRNLHVSSEWLWLTWEQVPVAVGFILALLTVGHGRHLLGRGAAHLLLLSCSPPHSSAWQAHLGDRCEGATVCGYGFFFFFLWGNLSSQTVRPLDNGFVSEEIIWGVRGPSSPSQPTGSHLLQEWKWTSPHFAKSRNPLDSGLWTTTFS